MTKSKKLNHFYEDIEDYFDDELIDDDMSYLSLDADNDFADYLDYRASRKSNRKGRGKRGSRGETSHQTLPDDWEGFQYG
jgi:hypothetical protein